MTYDIGYPRPRLGQAHKCGRDKPVNETPTGLTLQMSITSMIFYKSFRYCIVMLIHRVTL
jgi:hypothetical protein